MIETKLEVNCYLRLLMAEDWFMSVIIEMVVGKRENLWALVKRWWKKG